MFDLVEKRNTPRDSKFHQARNAARSQNEYKQLNSSTLESCAFQKIRLACANSPFNPDEVELISGQRFPDIIADRYYGIEVKSTKENHWTSTGSSIVETTRIEDVDDIYICSLVS